ncbi:hypothetical protein Pmani_010947 [Petrolisthes manimaculis]|uniref:PHD-type domain-containing protein n=1 Tax=Petrolisthes manimaculis TaxID=1843537 RepID=A0AAE1Q3C2_9EUCA|nr:hypothetical protein Pmani_010947 [Petrolisthes manimaculis]
MAEKQGKKSSAPNRKDQPVSTTNKATITKTSAADEEDAVCVKCDKVVSAQDYAICCEICESWFHIACQKIPRPVYDYMVVEESGKQLHWNCSFCKHGYENMHRNLKRLEKQQEDITRKQEVIVAELCETKETVREKMEQVDTMENRVSTLEAKNLGVTDCIKQDETIKLSLITRVSELEAKFTGVESGHVGMDKQNTTSMKINQQQAQEQVETVIGEVYRRNTRVNNLVVHGVPEERSGTEEQGNEICMKYIQRIMEVCGVRDSSEKIEKVLRLGKTQQDKDRPLLIELKHNHTKAEIFKNISNLKGKEEFQSIRIQHDLTKIERQHEALLRKEAKNGQSQTVQGQDITRKREDDKGSTLDLIFSNDETIIEDISVDTSLGKSDHGCISFYCDVEELQETNRKTIYMYEKADYDKIRQRLDVDWEKFFEADTDIEGKWTKFKEKILSAVEECVPKRIVKEGCTKRRLNKNLPMNRKLWNKIKRKQRLWEQMNKLENSENDMEKRQYADISKEYKRVNNQKFLGRK